jgi:hypothetical protein
VTCFWPDCGGSVYRGCIGCEGDGRENKAAHRTADAGKVRICGMVPEFEAKKQPSPLTFTASAEVIRAGKATKLTEAMRSANNKIHLFRQD